jgi:outer membrane lipoprotein SlyB
MEATMKQLTFLLLIVCSAITLPALAQRSGQSATVTLGIVQQAEPVTLQSTGAGKGAVVGGALGYATGSSKSKSRRNALIGGAAGAAVSSSGQSQGIQYAVKVSDESIIVVVSDQTQIQIGDCVTVEQVGDAANIRRQDPSACDASSREIIEEIEDELIEDASECAAAKQGILNAKTQEELELATAKAKILCN